MTPIYVPEIGGTSLTSLIELVRRRLGDFPQKRRQVETGDGVTVNYRLTDSPYEADGVTVTTVPSQVGGSPFTMDYDSSWITFTSPLIVAAEIVLNYSTVVWSDERITEAINSAIDELFGRFYVKGFNDDIYSDGGAELTVQASAGSNLGPEDRITKVQFWSGSRWVRADRWRVEAQGDTKVIIFEQSPTTGLRLRVHYIVRPGNLGSAATGASVIVGEQTLEETAGLPTRAKEPIVLLTCSGLIVERMHHRIRDDRGHNTQADNQVKSYEIQNDAQFLRAQAELLMSRLKMDSLTARVVC